MSSRVFIALVSRYCVRWPRPLERWYRPHRYAFAQVRIYGICAWLRYALSQ